MPVARDNDSIPSSEPPPEQTPQPSPMERAPTSEVAASPFEYASNVGTKPQAIEVIEGVAYVIDWDGAGLFSTDVEGGTILRIGDGLGHVSDMASDGNVLFIVDESGMAWSYDMQSSAATPLELGESVAGETLGVEYWDGSLFLLQYGSNGPMIQEVTDSEAESFPIDTAGAGELISLQMYDETLMSIDYSAGIVYRLVLTDGTYSLEPYLVLSDLVPQSEQADGGIRGMFLTKEAYYFVSISYDDRPGKVHVVPLEE